MKARRIPSLLLAGGAALAACPSARVAVALPINVSAKSLPVTVKPSRCFDRSIVTLAVADAAQITLYRGTAVRP